MSNNLWRQVFIYELNMYLRFKKCQKREIMKMMSEIYLFIYLEIFTLKIII